MHGPITVRTIITIAFARQHMVQNMVGIVIPLCNKPLRQQRRIVIVIFKHQVHMTLIPKGIAHRLGKLGQPAVVGDGMDSIQTQPVKPVITQPVQGILGEECTHLLAPEINGGPPWRPDIGSKNSGT